MSGGSVDSVRGSCERLGDVMRVFGDVVVACEGIGVLLEDIVVMCGDI